MGFGEGEELVEIVVGPGGVAEDVADGHEEGVECVGGAHSSGVAGA